MPSASQPPPRRRILVVDDERDIRDALIEALSAHDFDVEGAANGEVALERLQRGPLPDLIVLDLMMPVMDGWAFRIQQKRNPAWRGIPVIVTTANNTPAAEAIDAAAVISKPFDLQVLMRGIAGVLERLQIEREAKQLVDVVELMDDAAVMVNPRWQITAINDAFQKLARRPRQALIGMPLPRLLGDSEDARLALSALRQCMEERTTVRFDRHFHEAELCLDIRCYPLPDGGFAAVARDITERRRIEVQLQIADRMVALGTLAAGIGHEINNPLAYVDANLRALLRGWEALSGGQLAAEDREDLQAALTDSLTGLERIKTIVADLRTFARQPDSGDAQPFDLREVLRFAVRMANPQIRYRASVEEDYAATSLALGNPNRIGQVFLNLLVNAAQAISEGAPDRNRISVRTREEGPFVAVEISDTGCGIPPEHLARIFDPFFTTKPAGVGTGLGLSVCQTLVERAGGRIEVSSRQGEGTTFRVLLPRAQAASA